MAEHRPGREQLVQAQRAVEDVAAQKAELPLEIERREDLAAEYAGSEARCVFVHSRDHEIGDLVAMVVPGSAVRQLRRDGLAEQPGLMCARRGHGAAGG